VDDQKHLKGLITVKDIQKKVEFPDAAIDKTGQADGGAAVGVGADLETRAEMLASKGVDVLVVDTAHGHSLGVINAIKRIKQVLPEIARHRRECRYRRWQPGAHRRRGGWDQSRHRRPVPSAPHA